MRRPWLLFCCLVLTPRRDPFAESLVGRVVQTQSLFWFAVACVSLQRDAFSPCRGDAFRTYFDSLPWHSLSGDGAPIARARLTSVRRAAVNSAAPRTRRSRITIRANSRRAGRHRRRSHDRRRHRRSGLAGGELRSRSMSGLRALSC